MDTEETFDNALRDARVAAAVKFVATIAPHIPPQAVYVSFSIRYDDGKGLNMEIEKQEVGAPPPGAVPVALPPSRSAMNRVRAALRCLLGKA